MTVTETHDGKVKLIATDDEFDGTDDLTISRDDAQILAIKLIVASGALSAKEVVKAFTKPQEE